MLAGKSLLWVAALGFAVLYIYGVIAYAGYQVYYDDPGNSSHCKTLFQCVVSAIRLGLLNGAILTVSRVYVRVNLLWCIYMHKCMCVCV